MKNQRHSILDITLLCLLLVVAYVLFKLPLRPQSSVALQVAPADVMNLTGVVRDFSSSHPDFGITNVADMGHYVGIVAPALSADRRPLPVFAGESLRIVSEWYDKYGNPIAPYRGRGLPGGHFDVDVYDAPTTSELYHEHQFDDTFDITYIDVANDANLLFDAIIGAGYPNDIRMVFENVHNGGGGKFRFDAGGGLMVGTTADGFTATFDPALLTELRVNFIALAALRQTQPGNSQSDAVDRDDSFTIRMYDTVTNVMVYEVAAYNHYKDEDGDGISDELAEQVPVGQTDACGDAINDIAGAYGNAGTGGVTDSTSFGQWFRDELGTNLSTHHTVSLQRDGMGVYEYMTNAFFPIDERLLGNEGKAHNSNFTYTITASFTYQACAGQFFEFESNDDAWVFIDEQLVVDLGGTATPERQFVALDRLGLVDGQTYTFDFFFAHRRGTLGSLFHMRTNLQLTTGALPVITAFYD